MAGRAAAKAFCILSGAINAQIACNARAVSGAEYASARRAGHNPKAARGYRPALGTGGRPTPAGTLPRNIRIDRETASDLAKARHIVDRRFIRFRLPAMA